MKEQLERLKWSVESLTNINESMSFLITELEETNRAFDELDSDYINLIKENKRYREALEFYANKDNYKLEHFDPNLDDYMSTVDYDEGMKARKALEGRK